MKLIPLFSGLSPRALAGVLVLRLFLFSLIWWVLAEGVIREPLFPVIAVIMAVAVSLPLWPPRSWRWHPLEVLRFIPWFLWNSILGGFDVAMRACRPSMQLQPEIVEFESSIGKNPTLLFVWTVSLLPGTACIRIDNDTQLKIHILSNSPEIIAKLHELERRLAKLCA